LKVRNERINVYVHVQVTRVQRMLCVFLINADMNDGIDVCSEYQTILQRLFDIKPSIVYLVFGAAANCLYKNIFGQVTNVVVKDA
jgi:hypothetical protein